VAPVAPSKGASGEATAPSRPSGAADVNTESSAKSREDIRAEIRRCEDADIDFVANGYGERHPERLALHAELATLREYDNAWPPNGGPREARLALLHAKEANLSARGYGENHPKRIAVRMKIRAAEGTP